MSVSFCNENPNKLTQKWLISNKFYAGYYVEMGPLYLFGGVFCVEDTEHQSP